MPVSNTSPRSNLNLPEIKPRQVSSNSSLDSTTSTSASTAASSTNYSHYSSFSASAGASITSSTGASPSANTSSEMNRSMSVLNMSMDDPMSTLMADTPAPLDSSLINSFGNINTIQQNSQVMSQPVQPQQAPQETNFYPALADVASVDYSTNMDSINFLPLVTSNNQAQPQPVTSNQNQYNSTVMPIVPPQTQPSLTSNTISDEAVAQIVSNTSVPEFLYQLTKMLTDDHRDIIEWSNAKIEVHNPHRLEIEVLNKYFRHSKYASFQRQLNYFGFRKLAGKGKMAPCSYVNENATTDLRSLLRMKVRLQLSYSHGRACTGEE